MPRPPGVGRALLPGLKMATAPASQLASPRASGRARDARAAIGGPRRRGLGSRRGSRAERPPPAAAANQREGPSGRGRPAPGCVRTRRRSPSARAGEQLLWYLLLRLCHCCPGADAEHRTRAPLRGEGR